MLHNYGNIQLLSSSVRYGPDISRFANEAEFIRSVFSFSGGNESLLNINSAAHPRQLYYCTCRIIVEKNTCLVIHGAFFDTGKSCKRYFESYISCSRWRRKNDFVGRKVPLHQRIPYQLSVVSIPGGSVSSSRG